MARSRKEWEDYIKSLILAVNREYDVEFGPINGVFVQPQSITFAEQDAEITRLVQSTDIDNYNIMTDSEFTSFLGNYLLSLGVGTPARGVVYFQTDSMTSNIVIPKDFPVATMASESGSTYIFYTTQSTTMYVASKASYYNMTDKVYEVAVPVVCTSVGAGGLVPAGAIKVMIRNLSSISKVTNKLAITSGGVNQESRSFGIRRLKGFFKSSGSSALKGGITNEILNYVSDVTVLGPRDAGFTRTSDESGAVDAYILGTDELEVTDYFRIGYYGLEDPTLFELRVLDYQPAVSLISVITTGGVNITANCYISSDTTTEYSGSVRGRDVLKILNTFSLTPYIGEYAIATYTYNYQVKELQDNFNAPDRYVTGRDLLIRQASRVDTAITFTLTVMTGYDFDILATASKSAITTYVNSLGIGEPLEQADIVYIVKSLAGVDNVVFSDFRRTTEVAGTVHDIVATSKEYMHILDVNLQVV